MRSAGEGGSRPATAAGDAAGISRAPHAGTVWLGGTLGAALVLTAIESFILQEKRSFFTGGFLAAEHVTSIWEGAAFLGASVVVDGGVCRRPRPAGAVGDRQGAADAPRARGRGAGQRERAPAHRDHRQLQPARLSRRRVRSRADVGADGGTVRRRSSPSPRRTWACRYCSARPPRRSWARASGHSTAWGRRRAVGGRRFRDAWLDPRPPSSSRASSRPPSRAGSTTRWRTAFDGRPAATWSCGSAPG
jgi:hypothetical protein